MTPSPSTATTILPPCSSAPILLIDPSLPLNDILTHLNLRPPIPTITLIGGINIHPSHHLPIQRFLQQVLAPLAQTLQAAILDGGTDYGIIRMIGQARGLIQGTFPLIGVLPSGKLRSPENAQPTAVNAQENESVTLEPNHTHFLLTPGDTWGDESPWLAQASVLLSGDTEPGVTILLNGGDVAWRDTVESLCRGRRVLVVSGTGRAADELAREVVPGDAMGEGGKGGLAWAFKEGGLIEVVDGSESVEGLRERVLEFMEASRGRSTAGY